MKPLPFDPAPLTGLSERLILSHYENRGAVHMDYGAKAAAYVDAFIQNIHWDNMAKLYPSIRHPS
jgi:Fe-Mn family superoxide dismutase